MTTPSPTVDAPNDWDENRLRELLRRHKPFTPRLRTTLLHLAACAQAYERAKAEYAFEAALTEFARRDRRFGGLTGSGALTGAPLAACRQPQI